MWAKEVFLAAAGLSAGFAVAGGLFAFITGLGVIPAFADRTHTGAKVWLYEDALMLGGIAGNICFTYRLPIWGGVWFQGLFGILSGIFVGCWALSLADVLNVFPIFIRRVRLARCIPYIIVGIAIGKGVGSLIYFFFGW